MSITIECPGCAHAHSVPDKLLGMAVQCSRCNTMMRLPMVLDAVAVPTLVKAIPKREAVAEFEVVDDEPPPRPRRRERPQPKEKPRRRKPRSAGSPLLPILLGVGGVMIVIVGLGLGAYFLFDDNLTALATTPKVKTIGTGTVSTTPTSNWTRHSLQGTNFSVEMPDRTSVGYGELTSRIPNGSGGMVYKVTSRPRPDIPTNTDRSQYAINLILSQYPGSMRKTVEGRPGVVAHLNQQRFSNRVVLVIIDNKAARGVNLYQCSVDGAGVDLNDQDVQRFFNSVRFE